MQSNKSLTANGWSTEVTIQSGVSKNRKKNKDSKINKKKEYKYLGNVNKDSGGVYKEVKKYGRVFRNGVFYVICDKLNQVIKHCCFVVSLLAALSFLKKDEKYIKMERNLHKGCDEIYSADEIRHVYQKCEIPCGGGVKTEDLDCVYSNFLVAQGVDLVVYSDKFDNIIYDSRTDNNGNLIKLTNEVVCLWLNNNHYDVVLNMTKSAKLSNFCVKCMSHLRKFEHQDNHICNTKLTCHKCYRQSNCPQEKNEVKIECSKCGILFFDFECFAVHMSNRIFKPMQSNYRRLTPCQYLFFCIECDKICPRFISYTKTNVKKHKCNKRFCYHCQLYKKKIII